jgi:hypothetical protein
MFSNVLFGTMAILIFLSICGSWIHIFRNLGRSSQLLPAEKLAFGVRIKSRRMRMLARNKYDAQFVADTAANRQGCANPFTGHPPMLDEISISRPHDPPELS